MRVEEGSVLEGIEIPCTTEHEFIQPGKTMQSPYIESFNGRLRDECA
jgi:hypothetical protein